MNRPAGNHRSLREAVDSWRVLSAEVPAGREVCLHGGAEASSRAMPPGPFLPGSRPLIIAAPAPAIWLMAGLFRQKVRRHAQY